VVAVPAARAGSARRVIAPLAAGIATLGLLVVYSYATWPVYIAGRSDIATLPRSLPITALAARGGRFAPLTWPDSR
jgi:hypothetical protein